MHILTVELENVKSYEQAKITFTNGVNAIVGHNGAGKSTILEAIGFVLFDALDYNHLEFIRGGAKSARARVTFVSSADERAYEVERRIGSSAHYVVFDPDLGTRICEGKADVLRFLRQHLNIEPGADLTSLFKDAVGVPQGTLTAAFLLNEANRKKIFEALLRVEEYSRVWEKLREPLNLLKTRKNEVDLEISRLQGRLERLPVLEVEIAERKTIISTTQRDLGKATKELDVVQTTRAKLEKVRDEVLNAERALAEAQRKLQGIQARYLAAEQARADAATAQKLVAENQAGHALYLEAQVTQRSLDARVRQRQQVEAQRSAADKRAALHEAQARTLQQDLDRVVAAEATVAELQGAVAEQKRLEAELESARQQQARLEDARRAVAQQQEQLKRLQARRADIERQLGEAQQVEQQLQTTVLQSETRRVELDKEREQLALMKSQADLIKEQSSRLEDVQTTLCPLCEQPLTADHRKEMLARNTARLDEMRNSYRDVNKQVQSLETMLKSEQATIQQWQAALLKLPRADEAAKLGEEVAHAQKQLDQASAQVALLADAAQQVQSLTEALAALGDPRRRYTVAAEQAGRRKGVESQLAQARNEVAAAQAELSTLQTALAEFGDLEAELDTVEAMLKMHQMAYQTVLGNQRQAENLPARIQEAERLAQEVAQLEATRDHLHTQHQSAAANFDANAYAQAASREQELQREVGTLRGQLEYLEKSQSQATRELADLQALTLNVAAAEARMKQLQDEEDVLETIRGKLRQAGPYISATLNRQISDGARQIFSDLMQDYSRHLTWNEDYSISLEVDGRDRSFSQLSGGEQMSAALSVRLALLREMSSIDIAFFDEPTANLDEARREALARQILQVRGFQQLFVISHDDTFEQATQNLIRVERIAGTSRVSLG
jgi:DNA repair protein SbcC/Rad50